MDIHLKSTNARQVLDYNTYSITGWLIKSCERDILFKKQFCIVSHGGLFCFDDDQNSIASEFFSKDRISRCDGVSESRFHVKTTRGQTFLFICETQLECKEWINALRDLMQEEYCYVMKERNNNSFRAVNSYTDVPTNYGESSDNTRDGYLKFSSHVKNAINSNASKDDGYVESLSRQSATSNEEEEMYVQMFAANNSNASKIQTSTIKREGEDETYETILPVSSTQPVKKPEVHYYDNQGNSDEIYQNTCRPKENLYKNMEGMTLSEETYCNRVNDQVNEKVSSREECKRILQECGLVGSYMLRRSESDHTRVVISVLSSSDNTKNFKIFGTEPILYLERNHPTFEDIKSLLTYYFGNDLPKCNLRLVLPCNLI